MPPRKRTTQTKTTIDFSEIAKETEMAWDRGTARGRKRTAEVVEESTPQVQAETHDDPQVTELESNTNTDESNTEAATVQQEEVSTVTDVLEAPTVEPTQDDNAQAETTEQAAERKRAARPAINVGTVVVRKSARTDFTTRTTPTKSNPVFKAVEAAAIDEPTDILVENDETKIKGAISILRRAGAQLNVGMHIAPKDADGYPTEEVDGVTYAVITFKTSAERQVRGPKAEVAATGGEGGTH